MDTPALRRFVRWLHSLSHEDITEPAKADELEKADMTIRRALTEDELNALIANELPFQHFQPIPEEPYPWTPQPSGD